MTKTLEEIEKLKLLATNKSLNYWEREEAIRALGDISTKETALALLDIANDKELYHWERELALSRAREILHKGI